MKETAPPVVELGDFPPSVIREVVVVVEAEAVKPGNYKVEEDLSPLEKGKNLGLGWCLPSGTSLGAAASLFRISLGLAPPFSLPLGPGANIRASICRAQFFNPGGGF